MTGNSRGAFALLVVLLWLPARAPADVPIPVITGPSVGAVGDFIELSAADSVATATAWTVIPAELPDGRMAYRVYDGGRTLLIANYPGRYVVILSAASVDSIAIRQHIVTVAGTPPKPDDNKPDPPDDDKPEPVDKTLADIVAEWVTPTAGREAVAGSFDGIAAQVAAGVIRDVGEMLRRSTAANRAALGDNRDAWLPWFGLLQAELKRREDSGELETLDDHAAAWRMIAAGIRGAGE